MIVQTPTTRTVFTVPRLTGTPGDDLVAWGLALLAAEVAGRDVVLRDDGTALTIGLDVTLEDLLARLDAFSPSLAVRLPWLASTEKGRLPPEGIEAVDRDVLRDDYGRLQAARRSGTDQPQGGDAPGVVVTDPRSARYPLYRALTNPGTQWNGFNSLVELVQRCLLVPDGLRLILTTYEADAASTTAEVDARLKRLGLTKSGERQRNPPGFLYPGLNKGPTMRLREASGATIGQAGAADWMLADRGDRSLVELYLAYVGYFAVATLLDAKAGRVVLVPAPGEIRVPSGLQPLGEVDVRYSTVDDYLLARAALAYGRGALRYWAAFRPALVRRYGGPNLVLRGVHVASFWMPSGNTYSLRRLSLAPLPAWLGGVLAQDGVGATDDTIRTHERRITSVRGRWQDERKLTGEQREALVGYAASLSGEPLAWLRAARAWFPVLRQTGQERLGLWSIDELGRILMGLAGQAGQSEILAVVGDERFQRVANAIRAATVRAHFARVGHRHGFDPDYDLITTLSAAADRGPEEFLHALYAFAAHYNDATMRANQRVAPPERRAMLLAPDLEQVASWVLADRRGLVSAALLAYGSSRAGGHAEEAVAEEREGDEREADAEG